MKNLSVSWEHYCNPGFLTSWDTICTLLREGVIPPASATIEFCKENFCGQAFRALRALRDGVACGDSTSVARFDTGDRIQSHPDVDVQKRTRSDTVPQT